MPENFLDHLGLMPLDEGDDFHLRATLGTANWVRRVHLFDQRRPAFASLPRRGGTGGNPRSARRRLPLRPLAPRLVRVPSVVAHQMAARVRDVLGHFRQEVQRIEHLEVAGGAGE